MARAKQGGELGANGEFYKGGQFLNTVEENPKREAKRRKATGKRQIEPFVWEVQPFEGAKSIFALHVGTGAQLNDDGTISPYLPAFRNCGVTYVGETIEHVQEMCDKYNNGERWFA